MADNGELDEVVPALERPESLVGSPESVPQGGNVVDEGRPTRAAARGAGLCACTGCQMHTLKQPRKNRATFKPKKGEGGRGKLVSKSTYLKGKSGSQELMSGTKGNQQTPVRILENSGGLHVVEKSQPKLTSPVSKQGMNGSCQEASRQGDDCLDKDCGGESEVCPSKVEDRCGEGAKPTRQWAAWTHEEEECFFSALRSVGKNFEKITTRVEGKNKDQVRHYYYRWVKRLRKLIGPGFNLDSSNSKEASGAMLRWWTLMEKHSCTPANLRRSPKRLRKLVNLLEHQLLADRRKATKKLAQAAIEAAATGAPANEKTMASSGSTVQDRAQRSVASSQGTDSGSSVKSGASTSPTKATQAGANSKVGDKKGLPKTVVKQVVKPRLEKGAQKPAAKSPVKLKSKAAAAGKEKKDKVVRSNDDFPKIVEHIVEVPPGKRKSAKRRKSTAEEMEWEAAASLGVALMADAAAQLEKACEVQPQAPGTPRLVDQAAPVITIDGATDELQSEDGKSLRENAMEEPPSAGRTSDASPQAAPSVENSTHAEKVKLWTGGTPAETPGTCGTSKPPITEKVESAAAGQEAAEPCSPVQTLDDPMTDAAPDDGWACPDNEAAAVRQSPTLSCTADVDSLTPCAPSSSLCNADCTDCQASHPGSGPDPPSSPVQNRVLLPSPEKPPMQDNGSNTKCSEPAGPKATAVAEVEVERRDASLEPPVLEPGTRQPAEACDGGTGEKGAGGCPPAKLKLQLFPLDDCIRASLQKEGHNPHLELTLKARKSAAAVVQHLSAKWNVPQRGGAELRLFAFHGRLGMEAEQDCQSWGLESGNVTVEDIKAAVGAAEVFRLRYSWQFLKRRRQEGAVATCSGGACLPASPRQFTPSATRQCEHCQCHHARARQPAEAHVGGSGAHGKQHQRPQVEASVECDLFRNSSGLDEGRPGLIRTATEQTRRPSSCSLQHSTLPAQACSRMPCCGLSWGPLEPSASWHAMADAGCTGSCGSMHCFGGAEANEPRRHSGSGSLSQDGAGWVFEESRDGFGRKVWPNQSPERAHYLGSQGPTRSESMGGGVGDLAWVDSVTNVSMTDLLFGDSARLTAGLGGPSPSANMQLWGMEDTRDAFESLRNGTASSCQPCHLASDEGQGHLAYGGGPQSIPRQLPAVARSSLAGTCTLQEARPSRGGEHPSMSTDGAIEAEAGQPEGRRMKTMEMQEDPSLDAFWSNSLGSMGLALPQVEAGPDLGFGGGEGSQSIGGLIAALRTPSLDGFGAAIAPQACSD